MLLFILRLYNFASPQLPDYTKSGLQAIRLKIMEEMKPEKTNTIKTNNYVIYLILENLGYTGR